MIPQSITSISSSKLDYGQGRAEGWAVPDRLMPAASSATSLTLFLPPKLCRRGWTPVTAVCTERAFLCSPDTLGGSQSSPHCPGALTLARDGVEAHSLSTAPEPLAGDKRTWDSPWLLRGSPLATGRDPTPRGRALGAVLPCTGVGQPRRSPESGLS